MKKHFESGLAFVIVGLLSVVAGFLQIAAGNRGSGLVFLFAGAMWFFIAISRRRKAKDKHRGQGDGGEAG